MANIEQEIFNYYEIKKEKEVEVEEEIEKTFKDYLDYCDNICNANTGVQTFPAQNIDNIN